MRKLIVLLAVLTGSAFAQQVNQDIIPASTGLNLGHSNQQWNAFLQNVTIYGTCTYAGSGQSCSAQPIGSYTVSTLPTNLPIGSLAQVTDASSPGSCTVGGGSALSLCRWNGFTWSSVSGITSFSGLTPGTNTSGQMIVGSGSSLITSGTGFIGGTGQFTSITSQSGFQSVSPSVPSLIMSPDPSGTCSYPPSLTSGQNMLCEPSTGLIWLNSGAGNSQVFSTALPTSSAFVNGAVPQWVAANGDYEIKPIGGSTIGSGSSLPAVPCSPNTFFNVIGGAGLSDTLYRAMQTGGTNCIWQQIKPTVETIYARDYGVQGTSQIISDATTTLNSSTITCPNNDCNFNAANSGRYCGTNACVGDIVFAASPITALQTATLVCPQSTILTINSAQSITVAAANDCTANQTANAQLAWGPDDTTPLTNAYTAASSTCNIVQLPAGIMLVQSPLFNVAGTSCGTGTAQPYRIPGIFGSGSVSTTIVPTPNFTFTNCSGGGRNACFFGVQFQLVFYLEINGLGLTPAGCPTNQNLAANNGGVFFDVLFEGWCPNVGSGAANNTGGMNFTANESEGLFGGSIGFGNPDCNMGGSQTQLYNWPCFGPSTPGLIVNGGQFISQGNDYSGIQINSGGSIRSIADRDIPAASTGWLVKGTAYIDNYVFSPNHAVTPLAISGLSSKVTALNTNFAAATSGAQNNQWLNADSTSQFIDLGGNTYTGTALSNTPTIVQSQGTTTSGGTTPYGFAFTNNTCGSTACPGNMLQIFLRWTPSTNTLSSCTDTLGNTWTQNGSTLTTTTTSGSAVNIAMLTVGNNKPAGGADTISCSFSGNNTFTSAMRFEWKQANAAYDLAIQTNSGNGTAVSGTQTTVTNNAVTGFVIADNVAGSIVSGTCSPVNPCTAWPNNIPASALFGLFQVVPTAGSTTSAGTIGSTSDWAGFWYTVRPLISNPPVFGSDSITGTQQTSANWSTPAGSGGGQWGTTPSTACSTTNPGDSRTEVCTITVGSGTVGASPVLTVTFPTAFVVPPMCDARMIGGTATFQNFITGAVSTTTAAFTYNGTPGSSSTIILKVSCAN